MALIWTKIYNHKTKWNRYIWRVFFTQKHSLFYKYWRI